MTHKKRLYLLTALLIAGWQQATAQTIYTVAGNGSYGYSGDGGAATAAKIDGGNIAIDPSGNLYVNQGSVIRKVNASTGIITTFAGNGTASYSGDGGPATTAEISAIDGFVAADASGNIYVADANNQRIRMINTSGIISTVAGTGTTGYSGDGIAATSAELDNPLGLWLDPSGNLYISDGDSRIRKVTSGFIHAFAGNGTTGSTGNGGLRYLQR